MICKATVAVFVLSLSVLATSSADAQSITLTHANTSSGRNFTFQGSYSIPVNGYRTKEFVSRCRRTADSDLGESDIVESTPTITLLPGTFTNTGNVYSGGGAHTFGFNALHDGDVVEVWLGMIYYQVDQFGQRTGPDLAYYTYSGYVTVHY